MAKGKGKHKHLGKDLKKREPKENFAGAMHGTPMATHGKGRGKRGGRTA